MVLGADPSIDTLLLWTPVRRGGQLPTLGVALGACAVQAMIELTTKFVIVGLFPPDARWPAALTLVVTLPSLALLSYVAARIRPGAATMLTALVLLAVVIQLTVKNGLGITLWTRLAALFAGPSLAFTGGVLAYVDDRHFGIAGDSQHALVYRLRPILDSGSIT